jgi:hypothetical protein
LSTSAGEKRWSPAENLAVLLAFETAGAMKATLARSALGWAVEASFVKRQDGTDCDRNARKNHKAYSSSIRRDARHVR